MTRPRGSILLASLAAGLLAAPAVAETGDGQSAVAPTAAAEGEESEAAPAVDVDELVDRARQAAWTDRHRDSIGAYEQAFEAAPERRLEWLREYADQLTYHDRAAEAVPLYREYLASAPESPEEVHRARLGLALALSWSDQLEESLAEYEALLREDDSDHKARLGQARVLSWLDRQGPAKAAYERVLRDHPDDIEARRGLARIQSWRGRKRDAERQLSEFLRDHPEDSQAIYLLAQTQDWLGRPDRAKRTLRSHLWAHPEDEKSARLLEEIEFRERPDFRIEQREIHQSNDLRISHTLLKQTYRFNDGRTMLSPRFSFGRFDPDGEPVSEILVNSPGLRARHRWNDMFEWTGEVFVNFVDSRDAPGDSVTPSFDSYFTIWPNDSFRFDVGASREIFDSTDALRRDLTATHAKLSADFLPDELTRFTVRYDFGDYSDGNERNHWQAEAERRVWTGPDVFVGWRYTGFRFAERLGGGYFNPDAYHNNEMTLRGDGRIGEALRYELGTSVGWEVEQPGKDKVIWSAGTTLAYRILKGLDLEVGYHFFSSKTASRAGFERGTGRVGLRRVF